MSDVRFLLDGELSANMARSFAIAAVMAAPITGGTAMSAATLDQRRTAPRKAGRRSTSSP
jgi:hypothetical protein